MRTIEHLLRLWLLSSTISDGKILTKKKSLKSFDLMQLNCFVLLSEAEN